MHDRNCCQIDKDNISSRYVAFTNVSQLKRLRQTKKLIIFPEHFFREFQYVKKEVIRVLRRSREALIKIYVGIPWVKC